MSDKHIHSDAALVILADGALLAERNQQLRENNEAILDFNLLPSLVAKAVGTVAPSKESSYFFTVGARTAETFVKNISSAWSVQQFPLRAFAVACQCGRPSVRFTSAIAWALGSAGSRAQKGRVVCVSNDPGLVMPVRFAIDQGVDACLAWPAPAGEEIRYFAGRNEVPLVILDAAEGSMPKPPQSFGRTFLSEPAAQHETGSRRSRRE